MTAQTKKKTQPADEPCVSWERVHAGSDDEAPGVACASHCRWERAVAHCKRCECASCAFCNKSPPPAAAPPAPRSADWVATAEVEEDGVSSARYHVEDDSSSAAAPSAPSAELFDRTTAALGQLTGAPQWAAALVLVGATFCGSTMVLATLASRCLRCVAGARHRWLHIVDEPPSAAEL